MHWIQLIGDQRTLQVFGIRLLGFNAENGRKLLFSVGFVVCVIVLGKLLHLLAKFLPNTVREKRVGFWLRQAIRLVTAALLIVGLLSIWFDDPARMATVLGLIIAGLAFALQRVVTALAGYLVILRGGTFTVGDRITMGGVRGDVIALGLMQTTIMEMGEPPGEQEDDPAMWVRSRQYSGRIVTVTNDKIFDTPVYNYSSKDFPYLWEEMHLPIDFSADSARAEKILLDAAVRHTIDLTKVGEEALAEMERRYVMRRSEIKPHVYWRITDNWLELTVRFICKDHGTRELKDQMSREILRGLAEAKIGIASTTFAITGLPAVRIERAGSNAAR